MQLREEAATETQVLVVENDSNFWLGLAPVESVKCLAFLCFVCEPRGPIIMHKGLQA
jgi:hypothetical protein